jgi:hypothetical protein
MKKIFTLLYVLCIQYVSYGQSLEITPNTVTQKTSNIEQINMQSVQTPTISGIRHGNTLVSPTATANSSILMRVIGKGHTGSSFTDSRVGIHFNATQAWTPTANGTEINFFTTPNNSTSIISRMKISHDGKVGIGTSAPEYALDVAGRINSNVGFSINGVAITPGYYYASPWMNSPSNSVDSTIDGTCLRTRRLPIPQLTSDMFDNSLVTVYFRVGSIGPFQLPYISDAGGATNQIQWFMKKAGEIIVYRHTLNSCRFTSADPESYPGEPVMINIPQSLEYRVVITRP